MSSSLSRLANDLPADPPLPAETRAPIHVVYGGAHLFKPDTPQKLARIAEKTLATYGGALELSEEVRSRVQEKLAREAIEDFRIDFEDGYGQRSAADEDRDAVGAAAALAACEKPPPFIGLRTKPFRRATATRALRTLELFTQTLSRALQKPTQLLLTLPKVTAPEQVAVAAKAVAQLERDYGVHYDLELMIESKEALAPGALPQLVTAGEGRCRSVHFGAYDYLSAHDVAANAQRLDHPLCDHARAILQLESPVRVSDGATSTLPVGDDSAIVTAALKTHAHNVRRALEHGIYQGWDLHPAQCVARYAAVYGFFLHERDAAADRLKRFIDNAARARVDGGVFDDAATALGLVAFFLRGFYAGAFSDADVAKTGKSVAELEKRSFAALV